MTEGGLRERSAITDAVLQRCIEAHDDGNVRQIIAPLLDDGRTELEPLLEGLKSEADRFWTVDPYVSLRLGKALTWAAEMAHRPRHRALGLMAEADALRYLGQYPQALSRFNEAGCAFKQLSDEVGWARTRIGWVLASYFVGEGERALRQIPQARAILDRHGEWLRLAALELNSASVLRRLGRYTEALQTYDRALDSYGRVRATGGSQSDQVPLKMALVLANQANVLTLLGDFSTALELHESAQRVFVEHADVVSALRQQHNIAQVYAARGYYTLALSLMTEAVAEAERRRLTALASAVMLDRLECYLALNEDEKVLELAAEVIERFEASGTPTEAAQARFYSALAATRSGEPEHGLKLLADAAAVFDRAGLSSHVALVGLHRAALHLAGGKPKDALREAARAHKTFTAQGLTVRAAQAALVQARAAVALDAVAEAASLANAALRTTEQTGVLGLAHEAHFVLATLARKRGDTATAHTEYQRAVRSIERAQTGLATELQGNFLADKLPIYQDAINLCLQEGRSTEAFNYLERLKMRVLVDYLARHPDVRLRAAAPGDQSLLDDLTRLREEHNWLYKQLYGYGIDPTAAGDLARTEVDRLQTQVRSREKQIARVLERIALRSDDSVRDTILPSTEDSAVDLPLTGRTILIEFYLREHDGVAFVVSPEGILSTANLPIGTVIVRRLLALLHLAFEATARLRFSTNGPVWSARGILASLYRGLIQPVAEYVQAADRLIIVPYGPLHGVPFAALYDGGNAGGGRYLVENVELSVSPSSRVLRVCVRQPTRSRASVLVLANSNGGQLTHVLREAELIRELFPGELYVEEKATRAALIESASRHAMLHLAAHGEARLDNPQFAYLQLADGQLSMLDVFNLDLQGALVTLSGCETGRVWVGAGDELVGLTRGFLYAGASTFLQSLWRVDDEVTAEFMSHFYRGLSHGLATGPAVRMAMLEILYGGNGDPFLWAPFQVVGDAQRIWGGPGLSHK